MRRNYAKYVVQAMKLRRLIADDYDAVWRRGVDLLLMPVTLSTAPLFSDFSQRDSRAQVPFPTTHHSQPCSYFI